MTHLTILGGGPAGLAVAYYAHLRGVPFLLFEKATAVGGLCRTFQHGSHRYDSGAHRFHDRDPEITRDVRELLGGDLAPVDAPSKVFLSGRLINFPPTPLNLLRHSGPKRLIAIGAELVLNYFKKNPVRSFEELAVARFGKTLAQEFLINYSTKLWGLPAHQLSPAVATRRLAGMKVSSLMREFIFRSDVTEHIDGKFLYPRLGYGMITEALAARIPPESLCTGKEVCAMDCEGGRIRRIHFTGGDVFEPPDRVVSTLPLVQLVRFLRNALPQAAHDASSGLYFRQIRLVFLRIAVRRISENASYYLPDPAFCISRVHEPKSRSLAMAPPEETSLVVEVPCNAKDELYCQPLAQLTERVIDELDKTGLLDRRRIIEWRHHLLPDAYPVYSLDSVSRVQVILESIRKSVRVDTLGRNGLFHYSHLHDQMRMGKDYMQELEACG